MIREREFVDFRDEWVSMKKAASFVKEGERLGLRKIRFAWRLL